MLEGIKAGEKSILCLGAKEKLLRIELRQGWEEGAGEVIGPGNQPEESGFPIILSPELPLP